MSHNRVSPEPDHTQTTENAIEQTTGAEQKTGSGTWEQTGNGSEQKTGSGTWEQTGNGSEKQISNGYIEENDLDFTNDDVELPEQSLLYQNQASKQEKPRINTPAGHPEQEKPTSVHQHGTQNHETYEMQTTAGYSQGAKSTYNDDYIIGGGEEGEGELGCCGWILTVLSIILVICTVPFSAFFCVKIVQEFERAVIFRLGRLLSGGAKGPGIFFILPCIESYTKVDLRTVSFDVPPQEILTRDSVTVAVDAVVYYRVSNPTVSVANVANAHQSTRLLAQTTLRNILGTKNMSEILSERENISNSMQDGLDSATNRWGIKVERVEIKDVRLPQQLQRAMAAEAEASREAKAKVVAAEGEHMASRSLKAAADTIAQSPAAIQLRYLQTLNSISAEKNSTIIFPLPIDLIKSFMEGDIGRKSKTSTIM